MKFSVALASLAVLFAGVAQAHDSQRMVKKHARRGASPTYSPAPSTTTTAPSPTSSSSGGGGLSVANGIKRGLSYNTASLTDGFSAQQVSWVYNWGQTPDGTLAEGVMYIPMLWGNSGSFTSSWSQNAQTAIDNGATFLLGPNEPDLSSQSNMSPQDAAALWKQYMEPFAGKAKLISPAVTNGAAPMGLAWLSSFLEACSGCTVDAIALHIYDSATNEGYYQSYISGAAQQFGKPVFVTEFGASGSDAQIQTFLGSMTSWLDNEPGIQGYAWFMDTVGNLVNGDGSLTELGNTYVQ